MYNQLLSRGSHCALDLEKESGKRRSAGRLPYFQAGVVCDLAGVACWSWGLRYNDPCAEGRGNVVWIYEYERTMGLEGEKVM